MFSSLWVIDFQGRETSVVSVAIRKIGAGYVDRWQCEGAGFDRHPASAMKGPSTGYEVSCFLTIPGYSTEWEHKNAWIRNRAIRLVRAGRNRSARAFVTHRILRIVLPEI